MYKNEKLNKKLETRLEKCHERFTFENGAIWEEKAEHIEETLRFKKHIRRTVGLWERANHKWFDGTESDVLVFEDLVDICNEGQFGEKPIDLIKDVYVPIGGSAIAPHDLREFLYLPKSLIEDDEKWVF